MPPSGGKVTPISPDQVRVASGQQVNTVTNPNNPMASAFTGWFGPSIPINPSAPSEDVMGRRFDYNVATNIQQRPKYSEGVSFAQLQALSQFDLVRIVIETMKDKMSNLKWSIQPKVKPGQVVREKPSPEVIALERFLLKPDGEHSWSIWLRNLLEDKYTIDAACVYLRPTLDGSIFAVEYMDGSNIKVLIDKRGRTPQPPAPAYQSILKGVVAGEYTTKELLYRPGNPRPGKLYGYSILEQIITTVNIAIGRQASQLMYYVEGNVPEAIMGLPETWNIEQIKEFQLYWDSVLEGNLAKRRHAKFVPSGTTFVPTRTENGLMDQFDEWLARIICYAFNMPPLPFVRQTNRAVAETDQQRSEDEGDAPQMQWIKELMDDLIQVLSPQFKLDDPDGYELVWNDNPDLDAAEQAQIDINDVAAGIKSIDEVRTARGDDPLGMPHIIRGIGPNGFVFIRDIVQMFNSGINSLQPLTPPVDPTTGMPMAQPGGTFGGSDPLQGVSQDLLAAVGLAPPTQTPNQLSSHEQALLRAVGLLPGGEQADPKSHPNKIRVDVGKGAEVPPPEPHTAAKAHKKASNAPVHPKAKEAIASVQHLAGG